MALYRIKEVLNYGGFFGGDTVSAIVEPWEGGDERDVTIDEHAFSNLKDRYKVLDGFVLDLTLNEDKVEAARIVAAPTREQLREAVDPATPSERERRYRVFAYRSPTLDLWVRGEPQELGEGRYRCIITGEEFSS